MSVKKTPGLLVRWGWLLGILSVGCSLSLWGQPKIVAYVPNWIDLKAFSATIEYDRLTHIIVAFENPTNALGQLSFNPRDQFLIDQAKARHLPVLVSIGGGAESGNQRSRQRYFGLIASTNRPAFANKLINYVLRHNFDGLDVDLEGPAINQDYGPFIRELSKLFKPKGKLLSAALSKGYGGDHVPTSILNQFDFVNIMAYDARGYWDPDLPGPHASFEFATNNVAYWLARGLPPAKAILGVPFYGYGFGEAYRKRDYTYAFLVTTFPGAENSDQVSQTIWYNGIPTVKAKSQFVRDQGLGGVMIWSLDYDVHDERSLLRAIDETLRPKPGNDKAAAPGTPQP